jgi:hypothetical protein
MILGSSCGLSSNSTRTLWARCFNGGGPVMGLLEWIAGSSLGQHQPMMTRRIRVTERVSPKDGRILVAEEIFSELLE